MWTQCTSVTDRRTDRQTDRITITKTVQRIASHGKNQSNDCLTRTIPCHLCQLSKRLNELGSVEATLCCKDFGPKTLPLCPHSYPLPKAQTTWLNTSAPRQPLQSPASVVASRFRLRPMCTSNTHTSLLYLAVDSTYGRQASSIGGPAVDSGTHT